MSQIMKFNRFLSKKTYEKIVRCVSTSNKTKNATGSACVNEKSKNDDDEKEKNWISYGFDMESKQNDRRAMHSILFGSITLCLVTGGFVWAYMPDYNLRDWAVREAFLELKRREANGGPLIDKEFIPLAKISLPSDEELEDFEIII